MSPFTALKGRNRVGIMGRMTERDTPWNRGVTTRFRATMTATRAITAETRLMMAPESFFLYRYTTAQTTEKVAEDAKFMIKPYHPVSLTVMNSKAATRKDMASAAKGPSINPAMVMTASFKSKVKKETLKRNTDMTAYANAPKTAVSVSRRVTDRRQES